MLYELKTLVGKFLLHTSCAQVFGKTMYPCLHGAAITPDPDSRGGTCEAAYRFNCRANKKRFDVCWSVVGDLVVINCKSTTEWYLLEVVAECFFCSLFDIERKSHLEVCWPIMMLSKLSKILGLPLTQEVLSMCCSQLLTHSEVHVIGTSRSPVNHIFSLFLAKLVLSEGNQTISSI